MIDKDQFIEYPVPAGLWEDYVKAFALSSGIEPDLKDPSVAIFKVSDTIYLRVVKSPKTLLAPKDSMCLQIASLDTFNIIAKGLKLKVSEIQVLPKDYTITMATTKIKGNRTSGSGDPTQNTTGTSSGVSSTEEPSEITFAELEGGVIHNPPQATLVDQSTITESTDEK
jgi:hypothetical protein